MKRCTVAFVLALALTLCACGSTEADNSVQVEEEVTQAVEETTEESQAAVEEPETVEEVQEEVAEEVQEETEEVQEPEAQETISTDAIYTAAMSELEDQTVIDKQLMAEAEAGYTFDDPFVIVNPYGTAPLTAMIMFDTDTETTVSVRVKGHDVKDDITTEFPAEKRHILPILGLYAGQETEVELTLADGSVQTLSVATDPIDSVFSQGEVQCLDESFYDYSQLTFAFSQPGFFAYDSKGDMRYYSEIPAMPLLHLANGNYVTYTPEFQNQQMANYAGIMEIDLCGRVYNRYEIPAGVHHEVRELPSGNLLIASSHPDMSVINDYVVEIERATGNVVWELDLCQLMDKSDGGGMNVIGEINWFHNNGFWYDEATDCLLLSGRTIDSVVCVEKSTKTLKWILGTNEGWTKTDPALFFTPVDDGSDFEWQFAQHNVSVLPDEDGNPATMDVMLFDNGTSRVKPVNKDQAVTGKNVYSRAVVYHINTDDMTVSQKWSYGKERGDSWYSAYISGAAYDAKADTYWICSGGIQHDPAADNYDLQIIGNDGVEVINHYTYIDAVKDGELKFELKLNSNAFRCLRTDIYDGQNHSLDFSVPGKLFVVS